MRIIMLVKLQKKSKVGNCKYLNNDPIVNSSFVYDVDFSEASNRSGDTGSLRAFRITHTNLNGQEKQKVHYSHYLQVKGMRCLIN